MKNEYGIQFQQSPWLGQWMGYVYTTVEDENGRRLTGYKMDQACEPTSTWNGPRPRKYFGLKAGVLGYHFDSSGPPLADDPFADSKLREMGWGQQPTTQSSATTNPTSQEADNESKTAEQGKTAEPAEPPVVNAMAMPATPSKNTHNFAFLSAANLAKHTATPGSVAAAAHPVACGGGPSKMTRRAAYNALDRLRKNPHRMEKVDPKLREKLLASGDTNVPPDLVTDLMNSGSLEAFCGSFEITSSVDTYSKECTKLQPMTELQIKQIYGDDAASVMKHKESQGYTEQDPNCPGKLLYYMINDQRPGKYNILAVAPYSFASNSFQPGRQDPKVVSALISD